MVTCGRDTHDAPGTYCARRGADAASKEPTSRAELRRQRATESLAQVSLGTCNAARLALPHNL